MTSQAYPIPHGLHAIPLHQLDLRPDAEIDQDLLNPKPITDEKNLWFFWHQGFSRMHGYAQRNIRTYFRRFSKQGWAIRVLDSVSGSNLNVANFLDVKDPQTFPRAFIDGQVGGAFGPQHTSDLVRFPLLIMYGGIYADVGVIPIGDLDALWNKTVGNDDSPFEVLSYDCGVETERCITNYFMGSNRANTFFTRCHKLFLAIWAENGGRTTTTGMHQSPLLADVPLMQCDITFTDGSRTYGPAESSLLLTDYIIQQRVITLVLGLDDPSPEDSWNGPQYAQDQVFAMPFMVGAQLINDMTQWDGCRAFELMSLPMRDVEQSPSGSSPDTMDSKSAVDHQLAREIVTRILRESFGFKLATGLILKMVGPTLGSLWRDNPGADDVAGTYAHWLRYGTTYWCQDVTLDREPYPALVPLRVGPLILTETNEG